MLIITSKIEFVLRRAYPGLSLRLVRHAYASHPQLSSTCLPDDLAVDAWRRHVSPDEGIHNRLLRLGRPVELGSRLPSALRRSFKNSLRVHSLTNISCYFSIPRYSFYGYHQSSLRFSLPIDQRKISPPDRTDRVYTGRI